MQNGVTQNLIYTAVIIIIASIARFAAGLLIVFFLKKVEDTDKENESALEKRSKTLAGLFKSIFNILIIGSMIIMIMSQWGINIAPILTGAGIVGLAVGFGTQTLVRDIVTGFFILLENQYNIGDKVRIAGLEGTISEINLRTTSLIGNDGENHIIPNSQIAVITRLQSK